MCFLRAIWNQGIPFHAILHFLKWFGQYISKNIWESSYYFSVLKWLFLLIIGNQMIRWWDQGKWVACRKCYHFLMTSKCFICMQTTLQLDIWLQSYQGFYDAKNIMKQRNLNTVFANISKTTSPTSDSFLLIMSQLDVIDVKNIRIPYLIIFQK